MPPAARSPVPDRVRRWWPAGCAAVGPGRRPALRAPREQDRPVPLAPTAAARAARQGCGRRGRSAAGRTRPGGPRRGGLPTPGSDRRPGTPGRSGSRAGRRPAWRRASGRPAARRAGCWPRSWRPHDRHAAATALAAPGSRHPGVQPAEPVPIGAQVVGELEAVTGIGLGGGRTPAGPGGVEGVGVDGNDRVAGGQQPVHDQAAWPLDRHRQLIRVARGGPDGPGWRPGPSRCALVPTGPRSSPASSITVTSCVVLAQSHPTNMAAPRLDGVPARWVTRPVLPVSHCSALAAGVSLKPVCGSRSAGGGRTETGRLAARQRGHPRTPTEEHDPLHADRGRDTRPMRQRRISRGALALGVRRLRRRGLAWSAQPDHDGVQRADAAAGHRRGLADGGRPGRRRPRSVPRRPAWRRRPPSAAGQGVTS